MKAALIGFGYWGPNIAKNLSKSADFEFSAVCDADTTKLEKARVLYGDRIQYYTDYHAIINDPDISMCAVALRDEIAQQVARDVLSSGKHLFMEKPMAVKMDDALLLQKLAEENRVLIHVDHIMVYNPIIRYIKQLMENGELGDLIYFESTRANLGPHIKNDMNAMWDLAVHDLAVFDYLNNGAVALQVSCIGEKRFSKQEILTYLSIKYENCTAMVKSTWFSPRKDRTMIVCGEKKMVVFDDLKESEKLMIYDKGIELDEELFNEYGHYEAKVRTGDLYVPNIEFMDSMQNGLIHFADCIREHRESLSGPAQAIRVLRILEQADNALHRQ